MVKGKEEGGWGGEDIDETMIDYVCLFLIERRANNSLWFHQSNCHTVCIYVVGNTVIPPPPSPCRVPVPSPFPPPPPHHDPRPLRAYPAVPLHVSAHEIRRGSFGDR